MIVENLKIFSQNVCKNSLLVNTLLETLTHFDIILIQEPPWFEIHKTPSSSNCEGDPLMGSSHHPNWTTFARIPSNDKDFPRVLAYVNIRLSALHFLLCKDIFNHRDISLISFSNNNTCFYILNVYSDSSNTALKYLKDTEANINNVVLMTGDFNIRDSLWDSSFFFHSSISDDLIIVTDSFNLALSSPTNPCPTRYSETAGESNSVIDLMFLHYDSSELDQHSILPESRLSSDHTPLTVIIPLSEEIVKMSKLTLTPKSDQESEFIKDVISKFKDLDMTSIKDIDKLEQVIKQFGTIINQAWTKNAKKSKISKHSKQWWMEDCSCSLDNYRSSRSLENWKKFKKTIKDTKRSFFDNKIQEVANKSRSPWELMNWIQRRQLPAIEAITHDGQPCLTLDSLWNALYNTFNTALNCQVDPNIINEIEYKPSQNWFPFSKEEFKSAISKYSNTLAPGPDKLTWCHLKFITKHNSCLTNIVNIADSCYESRLKVLSQETTLVLE